MWSMLLVATFLPWTTVDSVGLFFQTGIVPFKVSAAAWVIYPFGKLGKNVGFSGSTCSAPEKNTKCPAHFYKSFEHKLTIFLLFIDPKIMHCPIGLILLHIIQKKNILMTT